MTDENLPPIPPRGIPLFQVHQADLEELERILPELCGHLDHVQARFPLGAPRIRRQIERVKQILSDIRWDYQPHSHVEIIPVGDDPPDEGDDDGRHSEAAGDDSDP